MNKKEADIISQGINYKAIDIGDIDNLATYTFIHPKLKTDVEGKLFVGELLESTGAEISFQELKPKTSIPFLHQHNKNEEIYFFMEGFGQFQVDEDCFHIKQGSIVKVAPEGKRTLRNDSEKPMIYMVIQTRSNTLESKYISDGFRTDGEIKLGTD